MVCIPRIPGPRKRTLDTFLIIWKVHIVGYKFSDGISLLTDQIIELEYG